ncbi:unnamed protein product [Caenorhabditis sp. 36 PRJEB53466]|nr:unnamed protein product [Caenorhabditis sp. 36 PRJEB53466]
MVPDELLDNEIPMSNAYKLLCEDAAQEVDKNALKANRETAEILKIALNSTKRKLKFDYKNLDFWTEFDVKHPLHALLPAMSTTSSSVTEFQWLKPKNITILETSGKVRIFVEIADELFGNRDFLNLIYPVKRGHYMCAVVKNLEHKFKNIQFVGGGIDGKDVIFPDLLVDGVRIGFFNAEVAKSKRFVPTIGNLRPAKLFGEKLFEGVEASTPKYNQRMLWSLLEYKLLQEFEKHLKKNQTARLAIQLIQNVLRLRHLAVFSTVILTARVVRLIIQGKITEKQEILTVLRLIFDDFISWNSESSEDVGDLTSVTNDVEYVNPDAEELEKAVAEEYKANFQLNLIYDHLNLASRITKNQIVRMRKELSTSRPLLGQVYSFDGTFIEKLPIFAQFDHYARLHIEYSQLKHLLLELALDSVTSEDVINQFVGNLEKRIQKTMEERYEFVAIQEKQEMSELFWSPSKYAPKCRQKTFVIGFREKSTWKSPLTIGPCTKTDKEKAKEFKDLWGDITDLRKFADTTIRECVVWDKEPSEKVPRAILQHVLQKMFALPSSCISWRDLNGKEVESEKKSTETVAKAFAELSALLTTLKGLPLMITSVHGISGYLRGTEPAYPSIFAAACPKSEEDFVLPEVGKIPPFSPTVTVHIKLEHSTKWGNDVEAIRRLTSSFYVKIAEKLREKKLCAVPTIDQLFVLQSGIVFKIVVVHDRILTLLEEAVETLKDSGATRIESSLQGIRLTAWKKKFIAEPFLQRTLQSFSTSYKFFGSTVQLVKKWLGSKLLSGHFNDNIIELLVVAAIKKKGTVEPQSVWSAFARVLHLISTHPWSARPLIVDFTGKTWNEEEIAKLEENFIKKRMILPPMVIIHEQDQLGNKFTREQPQGVVLNRLVALAQRALAILEAQTTGEKCLDLEASLLSQYVGNYDAVIELDPSAVVRKTPILERRPAKFQKLPVVELDPIDELVYQLNNNFHQVAMFFHNKYGGLQIGVMFKPEDAEVPAKISRCTLHKSVSNSTFSMNKPEILESIQIIGEGIVVGVTLQKP